MTSGKDSFCGGADLTMLETLSRTFAELHESQGEDAANKRAVRRKPQALADRPPHGDVRQAMGCGAQRHRHGRRFRVGARLSPPRRADNEKTRLGLPEIKVGLFPGGGGTQRIARMLQPADALQFLLKGDQLRLNRAKAMKLIDAVVPQAELVQTAKNWIKAGGTARRRGTSTASSFPAARSNPKRA